MQQSMSVATCLLGRAEHEEDGAEDNCWATEGAKAVSNLQSKLVWLGLFDYTNRWRHAKLVSSTLLFCIAGIAMPILVCALVRCPNCPAAQQHPFQKLLQVSQTAISALSFFCLLFLLHKLGLQELLLLHDVSLFDPTAVQQGYVHELQHVPRRLLNILLPFFLVELVHSVLWFMYARVYLGGDHGTIVKKMMMGCLWMGAWAYNNGTFLVMCLIFRLMCRLQVLRLQSYYQLLEGRGSSSSVLVMLQEHMRLRQQLLLISHRFRLFLLLSLCAITASHFAILFKVTASHGIVNFARTGDLVVCCAVQLIGFILCLYAAAKITHMAQRIVAIVSQWHAVATCVDDMEEDVGLAEHNIAPEILALAQTPPNRVVMDSCCSFRFDSPRPLMLVEPGDDEGDLHEALQLLASTKDLLSNSHSYRKRHALVAYLQHCCAGISLYGFVLDRGCLYTIFALELSFVLWALGKTLI
ncbi:hypothetical protein L7F22_018787 [Adiantum nelumboides]|nr:hypothetical protein [Adiantum nelumboides]